MPNFNHEEIYWSKNQIVAGVDEVGRGCLAGPVVSASVILESSSKNLEFISKVNDSKKLSLTKRKEIYSEIISNFTYSYDFVDNNIIDDINILQASISSMKNSIKKLRIKPSHILIDGNRFSKFEIGYTLIVKGDSISYSIAAASIVAKVIRDNYMCDIADKQYPNYGFAKHKGYATTLHIDMIKKYGITPLHRKTFLNKILSNQEKMF